MRRGVTIDALKPLNSSSKPDDALVSCRVLDRPERGGPGADASFEGRASSAGFQLHPNRKHRDTQHPSRFLANATYCGDNVDPTQQGFDIYSEALTDTSYLPIMIDTPVIF
jgi:hypothetical protein